jgi:hypothetical protein
MILTSGIVLPGDKPLTLREVTKGLFVMQDVALRDVGFFDRPSALYPKAELVPEKKVPNEAKSGVPVVSR